MLLSNPNRKSFALSLNLPLSRASSSSRSKDHHKSPHSPMRDSFPSPHSPLVPSSLHLKPEQPILPISLADGLDPSEKMKLLRKTRKLSRILGEVPIPVSMEEANDMRLTGLLEEPSTSASSSSQSSPAGPPPGIERKGSLNIQRSATVSHNTSARKDRVQRTRSLASLRPSLTIPPEACTTRPSPLSPVAFPHTQTLPPLPASPISPTRVSGDSGKETIGPSRRDSLMSVSSRQRLDSTASSILIPERTPEQLQRARAAKLARQLGEHIPPDVLLRASSPMPRSPLASPSVMSFADASREIQEPQAPARRASSTKRANHDRPYPRRRLSLDVRTLVRGSDTRTDAPYPAETLKHHVLHKKSNSSGQLKRRRPNTAGAVVETVRRPPRAVQDSDAEPDLDDDLERPLTVEKQRALNVRRARKMNQMFGNDPPPALYQITNIRPSAQGADESVSLALAITDRRRDSRATFVSIATTFSAPELDGDGRPKSEGGSSGENLSPLLFADAESIPPSGQQTPYTGASVEGDDESVLLPYLNSKNGSHTEHTDLRPASLLGLPLSSPSQQSIGNASTASIPQSTAPSQHSATPLRYPARTSFRASPPPFLNMFHWGESTTAPLSPPEASSPLSGPKSASETSPTDPLFRMRRMRAAKLSRFFGVGLHDITDMLVTEDAAPEVPIASSSKPLPPVPVPIPPVPPVPSLYSSYRTDSAETIPTPSSPTSVRPFASPNVPPPEEPRSRKSSGRSSGRRSQSATRGGRRGQAQMQPPTPTKSTSSGERVERNPPTPTKSTFSNPSKERISTSGNDRADRDRTERTDRNRSNSEPAVTSQPAYSRGFSTTVEVAAETRGKYFNFRENRRSKQTRELEMHAAIKQLRKIK
ncbi:hypothetical protein L226DRAFT_607754 [Lentinus tigrinus ALCF2SS1-7]|uniref:uncharacterized protein n=1 Tax=Lentinus tigrinus ALCF2SS1-7 TaxID=1328758 RepID=UPI0011661A1C|nr:hypothetical protein L226DRAFT_607754 [Lentinus tigrinus ALCF2SS1-7]